MIDEPLTRAKWLTKTCLLAATVDGHLYSLTVTADDQGAECLSHPRLIYTAEHGVAIMDLACSNDTEVWLCEDSGKVVHLNVGNDGTVQATRTLHVSG